MFIVNQNRNYRAAFSAITSSLARWSDTLKLLDVLRD